MLKNKKGNKNIEKEYDDMEFERLYKEYRKNIDKENQINSSYSTYTDKDYYTGFDKVYSGFDYYPYFKDTRNIPVIVSKDSNDTFHTDYTPPKKYPIFVCPDTLVACISISNKQADNKEFGIVLKGEFKEDGFYVSKDFIVPEQKVTGASVEFDDVKLLEYRRQGYNTVIHYHPMNLPNFSSTDDSYINSNFDVSILFNNNSFTDSIVNLKIGNVKLQVQGNIIMQIQEIDTSNIKKE